MPRCSSFTIVPESSLMTHDNDDVIPHLCENSILHFPAKVHCALLSIFNDYSISITINIFRMEETLEVEGRYYLEEVSLTDTASSKGTISPLPIQIKPPGEYAPDGKLTSGLHPVLIFLFQIWNIFNDLLTRNSWTKN